MSALAIDPPLSLWYCDECGEPITDVGLGGVSWEDPTEINSETGRLAHDIPTKYFIFHKVRCDDMQKRTSWDDLSYVAGPLGTQWWAGFLWRGPKAEAMDFVPGVSVKPALELFYRLFVPYYEQARRHFNSQEAREALTGGTIYTEHTLKWIIENSGN